jgi:3-methyladenine DNA glycosylase AlkD
VRDVGLNAGTPVADLIEALEERLRAVGTPQRAEQEKRYLKSDLEFWGASVGQIQAAVKAMAAGHRQMEHAEALALVDELWRQPIHERRMAAALFLERFRDRLSVDDLEFLERLIRESKTWVLVDVLAADVVGDIVEHDPLGGEPVMDRWADDADFWMRRASLLAELRSIRHGAPLHPFLTRADRMLSETEFFIRKAIGWVLREAGKKCPDEVAAWLGPRTHRASGVTMREAVKYLPPAEAERLMSAYREKRAAV